MAFKAVPVVAAKVPATATDFPVYIKPSVMTGWTSLTLAEAQSSRWYSDEAKTTELAREIVSADEIHVKVPSLTSTTTIYADYDGIRADYAVTDTYGRNAVWADYAGVWHFGATGNQTDVTGNGNTLTENGTPVTASGFMGDSIVFDGTTDYYVGSPMDVPLGTVTLWSYRTGTVTQVQWGQDKSGQDSGDVNSFHISGSNDYEVRVSTGGSTTIIAATDNSYTINAWNYLGFIFGTGGAQVFVNGASKASNATTVGMSPTTGRNFVVGGAFNFTSKYVGRIREFRVCELRRNANWQTTEVNNQSDPATFWGTVTDAGGAPTASNGFLAWL